ncbi:RluA family pseudouridine synthase [Mycoplasmopsis opalescens]|uniref:RluA family pseudouridine synthase n=1 Tax=Mycoplasmopsis opalescens TaxID=114886 RepID=UPI0004A76F45|nr:RluA family pseudouridine synthase [Mycoplasmopsis opalescens]
MLKLEVKWKERIDKYISDNTDITRNDAKQLILQGAVFLNDNTIPVNKPNYIVNEGWNITITKLIDKIVDVKPANIPLEIVYEDEHLAVINKKSGMVVHPAAGHYEDTLVNALLYHFKNLSNENGLLRPGIVHRIDKDTSGLIIIAKHNEVHNLLSEMLKEHQIKRSYIAIANGFIEHKNLKINLPIARENVDRKRMAVIKDGKEAITNITVLQHFWWQNQPLSLVRCELETGRTHQIRVHMQYIKHAIYGDPTYNKEIDDFGQRLHAYKLEFVHPITKKELIVYADIPEQFNIVEYDWEQLKN